MVWLVLSHEFMPAAALLLLFVPAELLKVISDSVALTLLVRRKIAWFTMVSVGQFVIFLAGAGLLVPIMGLRGAALAYLLGYAFSVLLSFMLARAFFGLTLQSRVRWQLLFTALLMGGIAFLGFALPFGAARVAGAALFGLAWLGLVMMDPETRGLASRGLGQLTGRSAA